jgi:hypothetical protein
LEYIEKTVLPDFNLETVIAESYEPVEITQEHLDYYYKSGCNYTMIELLDIPNIANTIATCRVSKWLKIRDAVYLNKVIKNELIVKHCVSIRKIMKATKIKDFTKVLDYNTWANPELIRMYKETYLEGINIKTQTDAEIDSEAKYVKELFDYMLMTVKIIDYYKNNAEFTTEEFREAIGIKNSQELTKLSDCCLVKCKTDLI